MTKVAAATHAMGLPVLGMRILKGFVLIIAWLIILPSCATAPQSGTGTAPPPPDTVVIHTPEEPIGDFAGQGTRETLYVSAEYGEKKIPGYLGKESYANAQLPHLLRDRLVQALRATGAFAGVYAKDPSLPIQTGSYLAEVILNPYIDLIESSKAASFGTLGLYVVAGGPLTTEFNLNAVTALDSIGTADRTRVLRDSYDVSGLATSTVLKETENVAKAWSRVFDVTVPHLVNVIAKATLGPQPQQEQRPSPAAETVPKAFAPHPPKVEGSAAQHAVTATTRRPNVTINYPKDHAKIASESVTLAGIVTAPNGVARVNVAVNGSELPASRGITIAPAAGNTLPVNIRIPLQVGENVIVLTAFDQSGEASQAVRTVYREGIAPGVQIHGGATPTPGASTERWAVVIGIDQYRDPSIAQLQYGVADAKVFYEFLISKGGVKRSNARLLLNKDATQVNIRRALGDFLKQKALKEDEVIIYYAGHGTTEPERGAEGGLEKYLVPWDADPNSLFATGIPMDEIDRIFSRIAARKILLVQDTCFSGGAGGRTFLRRGTTRALNLTDKFLQDLSSREGRMILTASDANQLSVESSEVGHGLFTYYLLQGLGGEADLDSDGAITVREIHLYLQRKVHERSGGNQTPQLYSIGDMVIVRTK